MARPWQSRAKQGSIASYHLQGHFTIPLRPSHVFRAFRRFGYTFVPQVLRDLIWKDYARSRKHFSTSYLNGLRGCTALKVFTFHYIHAFSDIAFQPWGTDERHHYVLELPILRYFYAGFTSHIFFGVAGYLTSVRLLQLMDDPDSVSQMKALAMVSASLFRRAFRLYLPVFIITLMTATYIFFGQYEYNRPYLMNHGVYFPGNWNEEKPFQSHTYQKQLRFWSSEMFSLTNIITEHNPFIHGTTNTSGPSNPKCEHLFISVYASSCWRNAKGAPDSSCSSS